MKSRKGMKGRIRNRAGSTMTEVMVSFAVLMLLAVMVSRSFLGAWQVTLGAVGRVQDLESLQNAVILDEPLDKTCLNTGVPFYFAPVKEKGEEETGGFFAEGMELHRYEKEGNAAALYRIEQEDTE